MMRIFSNALDQISTSKSWLPFALGFVLATAGYVIHTPEPEINITIVDVEAAGTELGITLAVDISGSMQDEQPQTCNTRVRGHVAAMQHRPDDVDDDIEWAAKKFDCGPYASYIKSGDSSYCFFNTGYLGPEPDGAYCEYVSDGYIGLVWNRGKKVTCPKGSRYAFGGAEDDVQFCLFENFPLPSQKVEPVCYPDSGTIGFKW